MGVLSSLPCGAGEFRVDSEVFRLDGEEPLGRYRTYFTPTAVYDIRWGEVRWEDPQEATILDREGGGLVVLDIAAGRICRISADELLRTVAMLCSRAEDKPPIVKFAAAPKFETEWLEPSRRLRMASAEMTYLVEATGAADGGAPAAYRQFADAVARLNATRPLGLPPNARLEVNGQLAKASCLPRIVRLTRRDVPAGVESRHQYRWELSAEDRAEVARLQRWQSTFVEVDLLTIQGASAAAAGSRR